jgi:hypothetical protein
MTDGYSAAKPINTEAIGWRAATFEMALKIFSQQRRVKAMGFAEFIIGPVKGRTRWLNSSYEPVMDHVDDHRDCIAVTAHFAIWAKACLGKGSIAGKASGQE